jgi:hypothetical protein
MDCPILWPMHWNWSLAKVLDGHAIMLCVLCQLICQETIQFLAPMLLCCQMDMFVHGRNQLVATVHYHCVWKAYDTEIYAHTCVYFVVHIYVLINMILLYTGTVDIVINLWIDCNTFIRLLHSQCVCIWFAAVKLLFAYLHPHTRVTWNNLVAQT